MSQIGAGKLNPPQAVLCIVKDLEDAGYEAWCVGGSVRDALLGISHLDWDIATSATPPEMRKIFRRTIPIGIEFGTVGVIVDDVMHEVTTFRRDVRTDGRHAVVEFGASLDEDLARRDFTVNAIAYSPSRNEICDPFKGREDLKSKILRAVGRPNDRMREDRLRALRAIRFASRFGFKIEPDTWHAIITSAPYMERLSAERIKQEIDKTMEQVKLPSAAFKMWRDSGMFGALIPQLANITDVQLNAIDHMRLPILPGRPQRKLNRLAALFASVDGDVKDVFKALRFSNADTAWLTTLVEKWRLLTPQIEAALKAGPVSDSHIRHWAAMAGRTRFAPVLRLADAFWWAERSARKEGGEYLRQRNERELANIPHPPSQAEVISLYKRAVRIAYNQPIEIGDLAVDGGDLQALGLKGPAVGRTLSRLLDAVITDPSINTKDKLLELAKKTGS
jgi:tRNA nucleotidyltransferase (CCA-adding enzyme)